jgi:hypothetical protein
VLSSIPAGVEVRLVSTGEVLGLTPLARELPEGLVSVRMTAPDGTVLERPLLVGKDAPRRYVWRIAEGRLDAGF